MHYVLIRDDDTNATTPIERLERLYAPFLDRGMAVNLALIPEVSRQARRADGAAEEFMLRPHADAPPMPIAEAGELCEYLRGRGYGILQHGLRHERPKGRPEFDHDERHELASRLERGRRLLGEAGLGAPQTFVAPYDRMSAAALTEASLRFRVISTGWYEWRRLPARWLAPYLCKKLLRRAHFEAGGTRLLSHPGCILSRHHAFQGMADRVADTVLSRPLTVLVTHWWEYFSDDREIPEFVSVLHEVADFLARRQDVRVLRFTDVESGEYPI